MDTNNLQFLKAYNELVTAFFNFMNVVNPQNSSQPDLTYIAAQLNQLLNYLKMEPKESIPTTPSHSDSETNPEPVQPNISTPVAKPDSDHISISVPQPAKDGELSNSTIKFCAYPELTNGQYKFKSSALKDCSGNGNSDEEENYIYKLTLDEEAMCGFVELANLTPNQITIITNNPSLYTPQDICSGANNIAPDIQAITSKSRLHLKKVVRGWVIAEGEKFILDVR